LTPAADPRAACIIGVARHTWHPADDEVAGAGGCAPEPLDMWERVTREAAADAGEGARRGAKDADGHPEAAGAAVLDGLESIDVVYSQSWQYDDAVQRLSERLGATPARRRYSGVGGTVPQVLAFDAAREMRVGNLDLALITGAEALATVRRIKKAGERPQWSFKPAEKRPFPIDMEFDPSEISHSVFEAYLTFALFDNARRAKLERRLEEHRDVLGRVMAPMTRVAAADPANAWFPVARGAAEVADATPDNRMVAYPYTKLMTSIMDVDMAAAVILASASKADELGVPEERRVYLRGYGYAEDPVHVAGHPELWRSPAMAAAAGVALSGAGIGADDVAYLDLYSCFASSVCFALDALGISEDDPRAAAVTRTGGLPYHGGPGSNYMTHSLAAMAETLRLDPGAFGVTSGVGMHMQKHAYGVWSTAAGGGVVADPEPYAAWEEQVGIVGSPSGPATVATYSVLHGRDGDPERALLVCDLPEGGRCYALLGGGAAALAEAEVHELIGRRVTLTPKDQLNLAELS
jgi:acetyl-CoA C-acetyltransferase